MAFLLNPGGTPVLRWLVPDTRGRGARATETRHQQLSWSVRTHPSRTHVRPLRFAASAVQQTQAIYGPSVVGVKGLPGHGVYGAMKAGGRSMEGSPRSSS